MGYYVMVSVKTSFLVFDGNDITEFVNMCQTFVIFLEVFPDFSLLQWI